MNLRLRRAILVVVVVGAVITLRHIWLLNNTSFQVPVPHRQGAAIQHGVAKATGAPAPITTARLVEKLTTTTEKKEPEKEKEKAPPQVPKRPQVQLAKDPVPPDYKYTWVPRTRGPARSECDKKFSARGYLAPFDVCTNDTQAASSVFCVLNGQSSSTICEARNVVVSPSKIKVSAGGEKISSVFGRAEEAEFPQYDAGAFAVAGCTRREPTGPLQHYLNNVIRNAFAQEETLACNHWVEEPVLLITRYEYANLYHTSTDWYNTWVTLDWAGLLEARSDTLAEDGQQITRALPHHIVWLDGHAEGSLDDVWLDTFTRNVSRIAAVPERTCYRRALFIPAGYTSPTYDWPDTCGRQSAVREFSNFVVDRYGLSSVPMDPARTAFIFREAYIAHPRNPSGSASRHVANRAELEAILSKHNGISLNPVVLSFAEQLRHVREIGLLIGVHGAGLTHAIFMHEGAALIELQPPTHHLSHFEKLARWAGLHYSTGPGDMQLVAVANEEYNVPPAGFERDVAKHS